MSNLSISVVIPTHGRDFLLKRAIESVLNQTRVPNEIIVVDDLGSKTTEALCASFGTDLIRYIANMEGQGASSSRNVGALNSCSDYVSFLDDDDIWLPEKLDKQCKLIMENELSACFTKLIIQYENSNISYSTKSSNLRDPKVEILMENYIGGTISSVILRSLFLQVGGFDKAFTAREEYDLWIRLVHAGAKIGIVEEPLAVAFRSLESRSRISQNVNNYINSIEMLNLKHAKLIKKFLNEKQRVIRRRKQYDFIAAQSVSIGLRREAIRYYYRSIVTRPSMKAVVCLVTSLVSPRLLIELRRVIG